MLKNPRTMSGVYQMDLQEHYLVIANEEAGEVAELALELAKSALNFGKLADKSLRFGVYNSGYSVDEAQRTNSETVYNSTAVPNNVKMAAEFNDLIASIEMLQELGVSFPGLFNREAIERKKAKVKHYLGTSMQVGTLTEPSRYTQPLHSQPRYAVYTREELCAIVKAAPVDADLNYLDVSEVTDMCSLFYETKFNGDISQWDVSAVTDMSGMFAESVFNGDISQWDVSSVTTMREMFYCSRFNGDISQWDVSSVKIMRAMFQNSVFNKDISMWPTSSVKNHSLMFKDSRCLKNYRPSFK